MEAPVPKRRGRKPAKTPNAPCAECIQRASLSNSKGNIDLCHRCSRTLGHARRSRPAVSGSSINKQKVTRSTTTRRRAATDSVTSVKQPSRSPEQREPRADQNDSLIAMPPTQFSGLQEACNTLLPVHGRLARLLLSIEGHSSSSASQDMYRAQAQAWLAAWEKSFARYLSAGLSMMNVDALNAAMTLKAHHLIAELFAKVQVTGTQLDWSAYNFWFEGVLRLATEVVKNDPLADSFGTALDFRARSVKHFQSFLPEISILDPVYEVHIRTTDAALHERSRQLLATIDPHSFGASMQSASPTIVPGLLQTSPAATMMGESSFAEPSLSITSDTASAMTQSYFG